MTLMDPIGDMFTRIRNGQMRLRTSVDVPSSNFRLKVIVEVDFFENEKLKLKKSYEEKFEYKNTSKKFELSQYEDKIRNQLVRKISERIILDLYEIK